MVANGMIGLQSRGAHSHPFIELPLNEIVAKRAFLPVKQVRESGVLMCSRVFFQRLMSLH